MKVTPQLVVQGGLRAIAWYKEVFGARELSCFVDKAQGTVVHADLAIGDSELSLRDENREWHNDAPPSLGGTPVMLSIRVDDAHALGARMSQAGATVVFPIEDHFYGERQGRFRDPFGHLWIVTQRLKEMSSEEIQQGVDAWKPDA